MLIYLHSWPSFDTKKGDKRSFIKAVVNNHVRYLIDIAKSQKRWTGQKDISLSAPIGNGDDILELMDTLSSEDSFCGDVFSNLSYASLDLNLDIENLLHEMPVDLQRTFHLLKNFTVTEAAKF